MRRSTIAVALAAGLLAGCHSPVGVPVGAGADPTEIPRRVEVAGDVEAARARAHATLVELGFRRRADAGEDRWRRRLSDDANWAFCPPLRVDEGDRDLAVYPDGRVVDVEVTVTPTEGGATVAIDPRFVAAYRDASAFAGTRRGVCNSFGVFETRFVEAMRAGG